MLKSVILFSTVFLLAYPLSGFAYYANFSAPITAPATLQLKDNDTLDLSIMGAPIATKEQCVQYLAKRNPFTSLSISSKELVDIFYEEGLREGIRPDVAFAQSLHETGFFKYGGDVIPLQNNYSGLGTTGSGKKGVWFTEPRLGVRAQIQHLKAYSSVDPPSAPIVDPRYELVKKTASFGKLTTWQSLNGKWAVPGKTYGQMILAIHQQIVKTAL